MDAKSKKLGILYYIKHTVIAFLIGMSGIALLFVCVPIVYVLLAFVGWILGAPMRLGVGGP
jgi:hypothetical protein